MLKEIHYFKVVLQKAHVNQTGMNQFYLYIPKQSNIEEKMFAEFVSNTEITMIDLNDFEEYSFKMIFENNEFRFRKDTGKYFRKYQLNAGDEVIVQKKIYLNGESKFYISVVKYKEKSSFSFNAPTKSFFVDYSERLSKFIPTLDKDKPQVIKVTYNGEVYNLTITYLGEAQRRTMIYDHYRFDELDKILQDHEDFSLTPIGENVFKLKLVEKFSYSCTKKGEDE